jgi:hypothetical protein
MPAVHVFAALTSSVAGSMTRMNLVSVPFCSFQPLGQGSTYTLLPSPLMGRSSLRCTWRG